MSALYDINVFIFGILQQKMDIDKEVSMSLFGRLLQKFAAFSDWFEVAAVATFNQSENATNICSIIAASARTDLIRIILLANLARVFLMKMK